MSRQKHLPFRVGEQVTGEFFTDRAEEVDRILRALRHPSRLLVHGPRRQGKSSAIRQAVVRREREGGIILWVDVATAVQLDDLTSRVLAGLPPGWISLRKLIGSLSIQVEIRTGPTGEPLIGLSTGRRPPPTSGQQDQFRSLISDLDRLAEKTDRTVALVLDEFQAIRTLAGAKGDWFLRDVMQTTHHLSFVCAGSATSMIDGMLKPDAAFYRFFECLPFGSIDPGHFATWIEARMAGAGVPPDRGVGRRIVRLVGPRTQDCMELALGVFQLGRSKGRASHDDVVEAARRTVLREEDRFRALWASLSKSQQSVLRAVAQGEEAVYAEEVRARHNLPSAATVQTALQALRKKRVLTEDAADLVVDDPYFAHWILMRTMHDGLPRSPLAVEPD